MCCFMSHSGSGSEQATLPRNTFHTVLISIGFWLQCLHKKGKRVFTQNAWIKTLCSYELAKKVSYNSLQLRWEREREEKNKQLERKQISEGSWHWLYHNLWRNLFQFKDAIEGNYWYFLTLLRLLLLKLITRLLADIAFKIQCRYVIFISRSRC